MSVYATDVHADQFIISNAHRTTVDALGKAFELHGQVEVKLNSGGGNKAYFGVVRLADGTVREVDNLDYLIRTAAVGGPYTQVVKQTVFDSLYTLVDESS